MGVGGWGPDGRRGRDSSENTYEGPVDTDNGVGMLEWGLTAEVGGRMFPDWMEGDKGRILGQL